MKSDGSRVNGNLRWPKSVTAISICSRQFQFAHGSFNFAHGSFNFAHGNFNLLTAVSICSRQFQFRSRQFQFAHGSFNLLTAVSISFTTVSISLMMKLQWISANIGHAGCQVLGEILKYVAKKKLHLSLSQPNCELCFEFRDLRVKKVVNSNVAVMLFPKIRPFEIFI